MFLDLDKFKEINDTYGHEIGDELLKQVAGHLNSAVRESDMVARLGGDEFVILLEGFPDTSDVVKVAKKIVSANVEPHQLGTHLVKTSSTIGISFYPQDGDTAEALLKNADLAMYHAKQQERGSIQFFHEELNISERLRNQFELEVQHALEHKEFELYYQPKIDIATGEATGVEALLYWHHPRDGLLAPDEFMSRVTQSAQALRVSEWVISAACAQAQRWSQIDKTDLSISINIDITHLQTEFLKTTFNALKEHNVNPGCLRLEVTESTAIHNVTKTAAIFRELSDGGVSIAIDGFGAGLSSLAILKSLPISMVKIDPCFMRNSNHQDNNSSLAVFPEDTSLISALIAVARACNLRVVATGVETQEQFDALKALDCDEYQGAFFSEPLSAVDLLQRLHLTPLLSCSA